MYGNSKKGTHATDNDPTTKAWDETFGNAEKIDLGIPTGKDKSRNKVFSDY